MFAERHKDPNVFQQNGVEDKATCPSVAIEKRMDHHEFLTVFGGERERIECLSSFRLSNIPIELFDERFHLGRNSVRWHEATIACSNRNRGIFSRVCFSSETVIHVDTRAKDPVRL